MASKAKKPRAKGKAKATSKAARAPKKAGGKSRPLDAQRDFTRQIVQAAEAAKKSATAPMLAGTDNVRRLGEAGLDMADFIGRRTAALFELQARLVRCHTPAALWSEQARFVQDMVGDYQSAMQRLMQSALLASPIASAGGKPAGAKKARPRRARRS
jgi:hypothetical protein